jgi:hypothetical protein
VYAGSSSPYGKLAIRTGRKRQYPLKPPSGERERERERERWWEEVYYIHPNHLRLIK